MFRLTAYIEIDIETGLYVAIVPGIPGAHTQAKTLDELEKNLKEVIELCLEEMTEDEKQAIPEFVGIYQIEVKSFTSEDIVKSFKEKGFSINMGLEPDEEYAEFLMNEYRELFGYTDEPEETNGGEKYRENRT